MDALNLDINRHKYLININKLNFDNSLKLFNYNKNDLEPIAINIFNFCRLETFKHLS